jgi:hypothetical protein
MEDVVEIATPRRGEDGRVVHPAGCGTNMRVPFGSRGSPQTPRIEINIQRAVAASPPRWSVPGNRFPLQHLEQGNGGAQAEKFFTFKVQGVTPSVGMDRRISIFMGWMQMVWLMAQDIKQDGTPQGMTTQADRTLERRVALLVKVQNPVTLLLHNVGDMLAVSTLVKQHIHGQVGDQVSHRGDAFKCDIAQAGIRVVFQSVHIGQIQFLAILSNPSIRKIQEMSPASE